MGRRVLPVAALAAAYGLLRGVPMEWSWLLRAMLAVGLLGWALVVWRGGRATGGNAVLVPVRRSGGRDWVVPAALFFGVELGFLAFFGWAPPRLEQGAAELEAWLRPQAAEERRREAVASRGAREGNWLWDGERRRKLPRRADFRPGNRPEIYLEPGPGGPDLVGRRIYVQAFALDAYEGGAWRVGGGGAEARTAGNNGWLILGEDAPGDVVRARVYHGRGAGGRHPVSGPQGLFAARVDAATRLGEGFHLLPADSAGGGGYETLSRPLDLDDLTDDAAGSEAPAADEVPERLLALPGGETGRRLRELGRAVRGEGTVVERLRRIRDHLRATLDYSLVIENPGDREPLANFLFYERRGHCEFFATAAALMARDAGVPSRVCYGWSGGTYFEERGVFVFRAHEAHAWAEVWLEDRGWVVMDATPPAGLRRAGPRVAGAGERPPPLADYGEATTEEDSGSGFGWVLALPAVLVPGVLLWRRRRIAGRAGTRGGGGAVGGAAANEPGYWRWFEAGCRVRGVERAAGETLKSVLDRLADPPPCAAALRVYHYAVRYENRPPDPVRERRFRRELKTWAGRA